MGSVSRSQDASVSAFGIADETTEPTEGRVPPVRRLIGVPVRLDT
jgi:hypothetical protein